MEWALDANKQHVHASSPNAFRGIFYICPRCKKETFLRRGKKRVPHFAHVSGQTSMNCELYTPPAIYATQIEEKLLEDTTSDRSLDLYIDVVKSSWGLNIKIPSAIGQYSGSSFLKFPFAWEGERTIPLSSIRTNGKLIRIRLQTLDYRILVSGEIQNEWRRKVEQPIRGLDEIIPTVFHYSRFGGRRLTENTPLQWGEVYVLVWNSYTIRVLQDMPIILAFRKLHDQKNWSGVVVKLPASNDRSVEQWIEKYLNRSIIYPLPEIKLVAPIPERLIDQEIAAISSTANVVIAIIGPEGAKKWSTISVESLGEKRKICHFGNGESPLLLSIGKLPHGKIDIWLDDDRDRALRLICQDTTNDIPNIKGVVFQGINLAGIEETYSLHCSEAIQFFRKVQGYRFKLTNVYIPNGVELTIKVIGNPLNEKNFKSTSTENSSDIVSVLNELLRQDQHVNIDAGGFGKVDISPIRLVSENKFSMSLRWREQLRWLLLKLKKHSQQEVMVQSDIIKKTDMERSRILDKEDQELLHRLWKYRFLPKSLLPYVRASINEYLRAVSVKKL